MSMLNTLVTIKGLVARPELNRRSGFVLSFNDEKGRYGVRVVGVANTLALKLANLQAMPPPPPDLHIDESTAPEVLLSAMQNKGLTDAALASACAKRLLEFMSGKPEETAVIEGGAVKLLVPLLKAHLHTPFDKAYLHPLIISLAALGNVVQHAAAPPSSAVRKQRAADAGVYEASIGILKTHKTSDLQAMALALIGNVTGGGNFSDTESRRIAAADSGAIEEACRSMRLAPHRSSIAQLGMMTIASVCAGPTSEEAAARRDAAVAHGALELTVEGMRRHKAVIGKHALGGEGGTGVMHLPGSVLCTRAFAPSASS